MKNLMLLAFVVLLAGCNPATDETTSNYILPRGMENCKIFRLEAGTGKTLYAVSCPHSITTTTYQYDKNTSDSVAVDNP